MPEVTAHFVNEQRKAVAPEEWRGSWAARPLLGRLMVERMKKNVPRGEFARGGFPGRQHGPARCRAAGWWMLLQAARQGRPAGWLLEAGAPSACDQATEVSGSKMPTARVSCSIP